MNSLLRRSQGGLALPCRAQPFLLRLGDRRGFDSRLHHEHPWANHGHGGLRRRLHGAFGLSRTELSTAYLLGTTGSALFLTSAGRLFDRWGARALTVLSALTAISTLALLQR